MLRIRREQLQAFQADLNHRFSEKLLLTIREAFSAETADISDSSLLTRLQHAISRAQFYELTEDRDISAFVKLTFASGQHFDQYSPFQKILTSTDIAPHQRVGRLLATASRNDWKLAAEISSDNKSEIRY
jgi:hypothetical protein